MPDLPSAIAALLSTSLQTLVGPAASHADRTIRETQAAEFLATASSPGLSSNMRECLHAGIWVLLDDLDRAHQICQSIETPHGSAWHAIVHRREGDFWNSKYWWRQTTDIVWEELPQQIAASPQLPAELAAWTRKTQYDAVGFVDLVERHAADQEWRPALVAIQRLEWAVLFNECMWKTG